MRKPSQASWNEIKNMVVLYLLSIINTDHDSYAYFCTVSFNGRKNRSFFRLVPKHKKISVLVFLKFISFFRK